MSVTAKVNGGAKEAELADGYLVLCDLAKGDLALSVGMTKKAPMKQSRRTKNKMTVRFSSDMKGPPIESR